MTRYISEDRPEKRAAAGEFGTRQLFRRPAPVVEGIAIFEIKVDEDLVVVTARDKAFAFDIPSELDEAVLIDCEAWITTASSSGTVVVSLWNETQGIDMLSTPLQIDVGDLNDKDSGTPFVINTANDQVFEGDEIWVNVDNAGTGAYGLGVAVKFTPSANASFALRGTQGPPGGMTQWTGAWQDATGYNEGDIVTHNGVIYIALQDHTSNAANDEPGVGTNWEDFWTPAFTIPMGASINCVVAELNGSAISDGRKGAFWVPFNATIVAGAILANQAGDIEVDVYKTDFGGYPGSSGDSITGGSPLALTASNKNYDSTLSGWDTTLTDGDILEFVVSGAVSIQRVSAILITEKN